MADSAGVTVALGSSDPSAATVPATLTIPAGAQTGSFSISTTTVSTSTQITITATLNGSATTLLGVAAAGGAPRPILPAGDNVWINDALPAGATITAGAMAWDTTQAADGAQSFCMTAGTPSPTTTYLVTINNLAQPVKYGETLVFYGLLDTANPPREVKVTWTNSNGMSKAAFWGERLIGGESEWGHTFVFRVALQLSETEWLRQHPLNGVDPPDVDSSSS